jgi:hypothetical protein
MRAVSSAILLCLVVPAGGAAQTTIGAPPAVGTFGCSSTIATFHCGQSFTVPTVDDVLLSFTFLGVTTPKPVTFELYAIGSGPPAGTPLFSQLIAATVGSQPQLFTPLGGLALTAGGGYLALIRLDLDMTLTFQSNNTNPYAGGGSVSCFPASACGAPSTVTDVAFQATFGPRTTAPEPSTWALMGTGLLTIGGVAARRKRAA